MNLTPSMKMATGDSKKKDMTVIIEKRVMLSIESCFKNKMLLLSPFPQIFSPPLDVEQEFQINTTANRSNKGNRKYTSVVVTSFFTMTFLLRTLRD